jgi:hypothetical protein
MRWPELELEGELDGTGAADLVERVEAGTIRAGEAVRQSLRRVAEQGAGQAVVGIAEVWMVKDVEELASETKPEPFGNVKLPLQGKIGLPSSKTAQDIAAEIALLPGGGWNRTVTCGDGDARRVWSCSSMRAIAYANSGFLLDYRGRSWR